MTTAIKIRRIKTNAHSNSSRLFHWLRNVWFIVNYFENAYSCTGISFFCRSAQCTCIPVGVIHSIFVVVGLLPVVTSRAKKKRTNFFLFFEEQQIFEWGARVPDFCERCQFHSLFDICASVSWLISF